MPSSSGLPRVGMGEYFCTLFGLGNPLSRSYNPGRQSTAIAALKTDSSQAKLLQLIQRDFSVSTGSLASGN